MFSTYKVAFYTTTYRYHVKRQDIGQPVRMIIAPHIQWNSFVLERTPQPASLLRLGIGGRDRCVTLLRVPCPDRRSGQTRCRALCAIDNKKDLMTSKLVSSPLLLSAPLIYVRDYCGCLPMYARIPPST